MNQLKVVLSLLVFSLSLPVFAEVTAEILRHKFPDLAEYKPTNFRFKVRDRFISGKNIFDYAELTGQELADATFAAIVYVDSADSVQARLSTQLMDMALTIAADRPYSEQNGFVGRFEERLYSPTIVWGSKFSTDVRERLIDARAQLTTSLKLQPPVSLGGCAAPLSAVR